MSKKAQNIFLLFGLTVLCIMVAQLDFTEVWKGITHAGYWFVAVVVIWAFLYILNASAWYIIIRSDNDEAARHLSFSRIYKLTVSGFALNYATPGGLMGGEPYRIMSISPVIGTEKASSSVILYAMTHMFSHFWFWTLSILLFLLTQTLTTQLGILLLASAVFCGLGLWFFMAGYRKGLANRLLNIARHIPLLKRWATPFVDAHKEQLDTIDSQIAALHSQNPRTFVCAVLLELVCRIISALEIYFVLLVLMPQPSYIQCILILAFTSLFANLLFFIPLQLGGREGGFLMSITAFGISTSSAVFVALIIRLRELIWTAIGLFLIKIGEKTAVDVRNAGRMAEVKADAFKAKMVTMLLCLAMGASAQNTDEVPDTTTKWQLNLDEVVVKNTGNRYSRKNNPAVELMKRVIAQNKANPLKNNENYEYYKYQKITLAANNIDPKQIDSLRTTGTKTWITDHVEFCDINYKFILPVQVDEKVSRVVYSKKKDDERSIILGVNNNGISEIIGSAGNVMNGWVHDTFDDVDIHDHNIRLLQTRFLTPLCNDALSFYHFYIVDTLEVGKDRCINIFFTPSNSQDIGFRGNLFVLADSTLHLRRIQLKLPYHTGVNFLENLSIEQEFVKQPDGQWVLDYDRMFAELYVNKFVKDAVIIRTTKYTNYSFKELPDNLFRGKAEKEKPAEAYERSKEFWEDFRPVALGDGERDVNGTMSSMINRKGKGFFMPALHILMENYVETSYGDSAKSKFDFGPINNTVGRNTFDGWRARIGGRTTKHLFNRLFWDGYLSYGFGSKNLYYGTHLTYSFRHIYEQSWEFPVNQLQLEATHDIMSPSDRFLETSKDNWFTAFHAREIDKLYIYKRQSMKYIRETNNGWGITLGLTHEDIEGVAKMTFSDLSGNIVKSIATTEGLLNIRFAPGETYVNTKQRRHVVNRDSPVLQLSHRAAFDGVLGSRYSSNVTELTFYDRFWPSGFGRLDVYISATAQWNRVPFPLLIMPRTNLSYLSQHNTHTFQLMNNMEFLNDRALTWELAWNLNGKLFNRVPLLRQLKWRERIMMKGMVGRLTDKNNPMLAQNQDDRTLLQFPEGVSVMGKTPYIEGLVGIHNIFQVFEVDYIRRFTYLDEPTAIKHGVRFAINFAF